MYPIVSALNKSIFFKLQLKHNKIYSKGEDDIRNGIFLAKDKQMKLHNSQGHSYQLEHNKFSDLVKMITIITSYESLLFRQLYFKFYTESRRINKVSRS